MRYRRANADDLPRLKKLEAAMWAEAPGDSFFNLTKDAIGMLVAPDCVFVAEVPMVLHAEFDEPAKIVGMVGAIPCSADYWYVVGLYVEKDHRGQGLASELLRFASRENAAEGRTKAGACVHPAIAPWYKKLGFNEVGLTMEMVA